MMKCKLTPIRPPQLLWDKKKEKYPLRVWMGDNQFDPAPVGDETNVLSLDLEKTYETNNESRGAGQNDITLIAYANIMDKTVVTFESMQTQKPGKKCNYKTPLICHEQGVGCINFIKMIDLLGIRI